MGNLRATLLLDIEPHRYILFRVREGVQRLAHDPVQFIAFDAFSWREALVRKLINLKTSVGDCELGPN